MRPPQQNDDHGDAGPFTVGESPTLSSCTIDQMSSLAEMEAVELDAAVARLFAPPSTSSDTTDAVDSSSEASVEDIEPPRKRVRAPRRTPRKRGKPTYYVRKDEISELHDQVEKLKQELHELKSGAITPKDPLGNARALMGLYTETIERNNLTVAGTQSLLASSTLTMMNDATAVPLSSYIHLPVDEDQRDQILRTMYQPKLQAAYRYMQERLRFLDLKVAHKQGECFDYPDGAASNSGFEIIPFGTEYTLREVYAEVLFFLRNQEITISEKAGVLTIRESDELEDFKYGQSRLLSTVFNGVEIESNLALFTTCEDGTEDTPGYAISAIDFVDQDDLHPYRSTEIGRKDLTAAIMIVEVPTPDGRRAISFCRWAFVRFCGPDSGMDTVQQSAIRDTMVALCGLMPKMMHERLALRSSTAHSASAIV